VAISLAEISPNNFLMKTIKQIKPLPAFCALSLFLMALCCGLLATSQLQYTITDLPS